VRGEATGPPVGELFGVRATGKSFKTMAVDLFTVRGDELASAYHVENWVGAIQQSSASCTAEGRSQMQLSLKEAQVIVELARDYAEKIGVPMNIAVVDGGGHLLAFARMDKSILGSIDIALKKAKTSVLFNNPSEALWEFCKPGGPAPATEGTNGGLIPYAGGVPIRAADGSLVGAVGVSGGIPAQDGEVARASLSGRK
jgi:uncharacterized protein GlcG (DUF336 family)